VQVDRLQESVPGGEGILPKQDEIFYNNIISIFKRMIE
jgi:hypothetical protein